VPFWIAIDDEDSDYSVVLEDDDRVAYGYLLDRGQQGSSEPPIVGDVWLYNVLAAPGSVVAPSADGDPPLNAADCVLDAPVTRLEDAGKIEPRWATDGEQRVVDLFVDGVLYARLASGSLPGWSRLACRVSPIALPL
jgi:hypothetical protein